MHYNYEFIAIKSNGCLTMNNIDKFDYWAAVYDSEPKILLHVNGDKIHSFFDIRGILKFGSGHTDINGVTDQIVDMPIEDFLGLAEPIPEDDYKRHPASSVYDFVREVANGKDFGWTVPYLTIRKNEDDRWKVVGHDGRHRARLLKAVGYTKMPVHLQFIGGLQPAKKEDFPKELWCQNDCGRKREQYKYAFPITADNYGAPYYDIEKLPSPTIPKRYAMSPANVKDEVNLKFKGLCPKANEEAKANYEKDRETDPYKRDSTVPYSTFKEFLKKQPSLQVGREERGAI